MEKDVTYSQVIEGKQVFYVEAGIFPLEDVIFTADPTSEQSMLFP